MQMVTETCQHAYLPFIAVILKSRAVLLVATDMDHFKTVVYTLH